MLKTFEASNNHEDSYSVIRQERRMDALEQHLRDVHAYIANALPGVQFVVGDMNNGPDGRGTVTITIEGRMMEKAQELMSEASVRAFTAWEYAFITSQQATEEQRGVTKAA